MLSARECSFIQSDKLWQELLVWHYKNTHSVCLGLLPLCVCVLMCVYKLRHGHLNTACLPTAVLSNSLKVCMRVCINECVAESFLPEPWGQTVAAEDKKVCQCVSRQTSLTHKSAIDEALRGLSSTDRFSNSLNGCLQLYKRFSSKTLEIWDWSIWLSSKAFTLDPRAEYAMGKNVRNLLSFHIVIGKGFSRHFLSYM